MHWHAFVVRGIVFAPRCINAFVFCWLIIDSNVSEDLERKKSNAKELPDRKPIVERFPHFISLLIISVFVFISFFRVVFVVICYLYCRRFRNCLPPSDTQVLSTIAVLAHSMETEQPYISAHVPLHLVSQVLISKNRSSDQQFSVSMRLQT